MNKKLKFKKQIPINEINYADFKEAINEKPTLCYINGARANNPNNKNISIDVSFKILDSVVITAPGTSNTGKTLYYDNIIPYYDEMDIENKNVTLNFKVSKTVERGIIEVNNTHELYNILAIALKSKGLMDKTEKGSINLYYADINEYLEDTKLLLYSTKLCGGYEINAGEIQ